MPRPTKAIATIAFALTIVGSVAGQAWAPHVFFGTTGATTCAVPVSGPGTFRGSFVLDHFEARSGQLVAIGTLTGSCQDSDDANTVTTFDSTRLVAVPVLIAATKCQKLDMTLGPATDGKMTVGTWTETILPTTDAAKGQLCALGAMAGNRADGDLVRNLDLLLSRL